MSFREVPTDTLFAKRRLIEALTRRLFNHQASGPWADVVRGLSNTIDLKLVSRLEFGSGAVAMRYEPRWYPSGC
ncbi:MAG: hypothetical protein ACLP1X_23765 [Polyangiaceae bacterium]